LSNQTSFELLNLLGSIVTMKQNLEILDKVRFTEMGMKYLENVDVESADSISLASLSLNMILRISEEINIPKGKIIRPIPKLVLSLSNYFELILSILEKNNQKLFHQIFPLLHKIFDLNDLIVPDLYKTKLFYLLFSNLNGISRLTDDSIPLVKSIYRKQNFNGNFLLRLLPVSLVNIFDTGDFLKIYFENTNSPTLIWNESMRFHLESLIVDYLKLNDFEILMDQVEYKELTNEMYLGGYYLKNLLRDKDTYEISNPNEFFSLILIEFRNESKMERLEILINIQSYLILKYKLEIKEYEDYGILFNLISVYDKPTWNVDLVESVIELFFILYSKDLLNIKSEDAEEYFKIFFALLFSCYRKLKENVSINSYKSILQYILKIFILSFESIPSLLFNDDLFYVILLFSLVEEEDEMLFDSSLRLLTKLSASNTYVMKKIWDKGLPFILFRNILSEVKVDVFLKLTRVIQSNPENEVFGAIYTKISSFLI
jgi:hypothetical protein